MNAMRRWLRAVSRVEPQVLGQLLRVGDAAALHEVFVRLGGFPAFKELCEAYTAVIAAPSDGITVELPPLRVVDPAVPSSAAAWPGASREGGEVEDLGLGACGELWVLLLLLLPEHLRAAVAGDLAGPWVAQGVAGAVRGPWALPLEALRETLGHILPAPQARRCAPRRLR